MSKALKKAQKASSTTLSQALEPYRIMELHSKTYSVTLLKASELSSAFRDDVWNIFHANMEGLYKSTNVFEWDPVEKLAELFHQDSRFLLVDSEELGNDIVAYSMFRFDMEEDIHGKDEYVLYCYELQVTAPCRGIGIGKWLVRMLEKLAAEWKTKKIMLTVLQANVAATRFYEREGFTTDEISPEGEEYYILSKVV